MNENNNEQEQPLYKEQPWWVQIFVALYAMFWLTMIFAAGLNSLYIGKIDIDTKKRQHFDNYNVSTSKFQNIIALVSIFLDQYNILRLKCIGVHKQHHH